MGRIMIDTTPQGAEFMERIVNIMIRLFAMSRGEAMGRLNRHWSGQQFRTAGKQMALFHETPEWWAKTIVYGPASEWWLDEENARALPYP